MKILADWIANNSYLATIGLLATLLSLALAVLMPIIQRKKKILYYECCTTSLITDKILEINDIDVYYKNIRVEKLVSTNLKITNGGNTLITRSDIYMNHDLKIKINDSEKILSAYVAKVSSDTCNFSVNISNIDKNEVIINFDYIERGESAKIVIMHTGDEDTPIEITGRIIEGKLIDRKIISDRYELALQLLTPITPFGVIGFFIQTTKIKRSLLKK